MDWKEETCVIVLDGSLPLGVLANAAAILGITLGKKLPEAVGEDVADGSGRVHPGIIAFPVPVLRGTQESLQEMRERLYQPEFQDLFTADFSELAQGCKTYEEYVETMGQAPGSGLRYLGVAVCGRRKKVKHLTGRMPLLR